MSYSLYSRQAGFMVFKGAVSKKTGRIGLITTDEVRLYDFSIRSLFEQTSPSYFYQIFVRTEFVYFLDR